MWLVRLQCSMKTTWDSYQTSNGLRTRKDARRVRPGRQTKRQDCRDTQPWINFWGPQILYMKGLRAHHRPDGGRIHSGHTWSMTSQSNEQQNRLFILLQAACWFLRFKQKNQEGRMRGAFLGGGECCIISGMDRMSWVRKGGGSRGVNMKTGPYGEKGVWSNGRSVSALQRRGETEQQKTGLVGLKNTMKMVWG